jgi:hypothetical protein
MNCDEFVTSPSGGEVAAASDGFETVELAESPALADKQQQGKTEATTRTRMKRQRGNFTAGFLLEPVTPYAARSTSRIAGIVIHPRN